MTHRYRCKNALTPKQDKRRTPPKILNPFYDPVCKLLMQDKNCARLLLSKILREKIRKLTLLAEEVPVKIKPSKKAQAILTKAGVKLPKNQLYKCLRLDFRASIKTRRKRAKIVLIEIQKVHTLADIPRFKAYLGTQYLNKDDAKKPLIAIYLLGTKLPESLKYQDFKEPIIHGRIHYHSVLSQQELEGHSPFIAKLTHEAYVIQVPYLPSTPTSELEKALLIFNPHYVAPNPHFLTLQEGDLKGEYAILWRCLAKAAAKPGIEKAMQAVDEYVETFDAYADEVIKYQKLAKKAKALAAKKYQAEVEAYKQRLVRIKQERLKAEQRIKELEELLQQKNPK